MSPNNAQMNAQVYVEQISALIGLPIPPDLQPEVVANFERIVATAQPVLDFEVPEAFEPGFTFDP